MVNDGFIHVCALEDLPSGEAVRAEIDDVAIAIVRQGDEVFAIGDECTHGKVSLSEGEVDGCALECWLHGSSFDLRTGKPTMPPATIPVPTYPVEVRDGDVYLNPTPGQSIENTHTKPLN